jgi:hypothetical protein
MSTLFFQGIDDPYKGYRLSQFKIPDRFESRLQLSKSSIVMQIIGLDSSHLNHYDKESLTAHEKRTLHHDYEAVDPKLPSLDSQQFVVEKSRPICILTGPSGPFVSRQQLRSHKPRISPPFKTLCILQEGDPQDGQILGYD